MTLNHLAKSAGIVAIAATFGGCSTWHHMDRTEGTAVGAGSGAVAGAVVAGPVGAVVGAVGGGYVGHETTGKPPANNYNTPTASNAPTSHYDPALVRSVQQALNDRGYSAGPVDGLYGASTQEAVRRFQRAQGQVETGELGSTTLAALGV